MRPQFVTFTIFCSLVNMFVLYYMAIFCNIYQKSVDAMYQAVFLTIFLNVIVIDTLVHFLSSIFRSLIKLWTTKYFNF